MRVMLMGRDTRAMEHATRRLTSEGHEVLRCHSPGEAPFPCAGMHGECPLNEGPADVAIVFRDDAWPRPTPHDRGVPCVVREYTPLVLAGTSVLNPYEDWVAEHVPRGVDPVSVAIKVAGRPLEQHTRIARQALDGDSIDGGIAVHRRGGRIEARCETTASSPLALENAARRVIAALRAFDHAARGIDVTLVGPTGEYALSAQT